jgi:hypothetical protein
MATEALARDRGTIAMNPHFERDADVALETRYLLRKVKNCAYCDCELGKEFHIDHVIPLARGGRDHPSNMVKACVKCNMRKGAKLWDPLPWAIFGDGSCESDNYDEDDLDRFDQILGHMPISFWPEIQRAMK